MIAIDLRQKRALRNARVRARYATLQGRVKHLARIKKYRTSPHGRAAIRAAEKRLRATDKGKKARRREMLKRLYNITPEEYSLLVDAHNGCWICNVLPKTRNHAVDHDHKTGAIRGILCHRCNRGLQMYADKPERLELAAEYLRSTKATTLLKEARAKNETTVSSTANTQSTLSAITSVSTSGN